MKKSKTIFGALIVSAFILTSCGSSVESDASKMAEMQCKTFKMLEKVGKGEVNLNESAALAAEIDLFDKEMKKKYASVEEKKKFEEACLKAVAAECK